jgi:hypothetical protein
VAAVLLIGAVELQAVTKISDVANAMGFMAFFIFTTFLSTKNKHITFTLNWQYPEN